MEELERLLVRAGIRGLLITGRYDVLNKGIGESEITITLRIERQPVNWQENEEILSISSLQQCVCDLLRPTCKIIRLIYVFIFKMMKNYWYICNSDERQH
jgi:hypothetical protein